MQCCASSSITRVPARSVAAHKVSSRSIRPIAARAFHSEVPNDNLKPATSPVAKCGTAIAVAAAALALFATPAHAALDTKTFKAGEGAKIESSDLRDQSPRDIVKSLKEQVMPQAEEKLGEAADRAGGNYAQSIVQELETVKSEIDALERQIEQGGSSKSVVKSTASGIEQQVNALKAMLGFD